MLFDRTFHPDEANQAFAVGKLLETGSYTYNPADHHGPTLYYAAAPVQRLCGATGTASLEEVPLRSVPLAFAVLTLVFAFLAARRLIADKGRAFNGSVAYLCGQGLRYNQGLPQQRHHHSAG